MISTTYNWELLDSTPPGCVVVGGGNSEYSPARALCTELLNFFKADAGIMKQEFRWIVKEKGSVVV